MQRNFALDCFRALAIMLVFVAHTINSFGSPVYLAPLQFGGTGVDLFFVLSGWLIGNQLLIEKKKFASIDVTRFWIRRWMRTMPAYYAVLFATLTQLYLTKSNLTFPWPHLFFLQNYLGDTNIFYVSWSLSVEEQFYLLIAPVFVLTLRLHERYQILVLLTLLLLPTVFRYFQLYDSLIETHVRLDCCAMGVLLAYLKHFKPAFWLVIQRYILPVFVLSIAIYLFFYVARYNPEWKVTDPSKLILALLFGVWIVWSDKTQFDVDGIFTRITLHISTRSYAMYLLHVDALAIIKRFTDDLPFVVFFAVALAVTLILSEILYRVIELPFMNARKKFRFSKSRSSTLTADTTVKVSV